MFIPFVIPSLSRSHPHHASTADEHYNHERDQQYGVPVHFFLDHVVRTTTPTSQREQQPDVQPDRPLDP